MKTFKARYIFPVADHPIRDGVIELDGDHIVSIRPNTGMDARDLGNVAVLPGFINAHTHLDFSDLPAPLGQPGIDFIAWIGLLMAFRQQVADSERNPVELGLQESIQTGTTTLADIVQSGFPHLSGLPFTPSFIAFQEILGPTQSRIAPALQLAQDYSNRAGASSIFEAGLSPHAPYSVHPDLLAALIKLSADRHLPLAMHLAETPEELQLLRDGSGPFRLFLETMGGWENESHPSGRRPLDLLKILSAAQRALIIHGGYLEKEEWAFLAHHAERMAVVYCPRTHAWFGRKPYPLEQMLDAGVAVALGTDGRGSTPDLNMLHEMRFAAQTHPGVPLRQILRLATLDAAKALGREHRIGSLEPGKWADLAIVKLPDRDANDPYELLFDEEASVTACFCRGNLAFVNDNQIIA